jgi:hypothetical protein
MRFGAYWAQLSTYYADTLNATMVLGPAYLLAERYASIWVRGMPEFLAYIDALIEGGGTLPNRRKYDLLKPVVQEHSTEVKEFFASYLRRDLSDGVLAHGRCRPHRPLRRTMQHAGFR